MVFNENTVFTVSLANENATRLILTKLPTIVGKEKELAIRAFLCHSTAIQLVWLQARIKSICQRRVRCVRCRHGRQTPLTKDIDYHWYGELSEGIRSHGRQCCGIVLNRR